MTLPTRQGSGVEIDALFAGGAKRVSPACWVSNPGQLFFATRLLLRREARIDRRPIQQPCSSPALQEPIRPQCQISAGYQWS